MYAIRHSRARKLRPVDLIDAHSAPRHVIYLAATRKSEDSGSITCLEFQVGGTRFRPLIQISRSLM